MKKKKTKRRKRSDRGRSLGGKEGVQGKTQEVGKEAESDHPYPHL